MSKFKPVRFTPVERYISAASNQDRRELYEERQRKEGLKVVSVRVHIDDAQAVKDFAQFLREKRRAVSGD